LRLQAKQTGTGLGEVGSNKVELTVVGANTGFYS
jgi:hypothetical protein